MTLDEMFKRLSLEVGGDGKTITKKQLDDYIAKANNGSIDVSKAKLKALTTIQKHWDEISGNKDSITAGDMEKYKIFLMQAFTGDFEKTETPIDKQSAKKNLYEYLAEVLNAKDEGISKDDLSSYLQSLISESSDETDNSDEIALITNVIADFSALSAGSKSITTDSITLSTELEA